MKKYVKVFLGNWSYASHDERELNAAAQMGFEPLVICASNKSNKIIRKRIEEYNVILLPTRRLGENKRFLLFNRIIAILEFVVQTRKAHAIVLSGHNYPAFLVCMLAEIGRKPKAKLIYDSHEFTLFSSKRNILRRKLVKLVEGIILRSADLNLMVSEGIAGEVQQIYGLNERPTVVRNIAYRTKIDKLKVQEIKEMFRQKLKLKKDDRILMYHGNISRGRELEVQMDVLLYDKDIGFVMMGNAGDPSYLDELKKRAEERGYRDRIYFMNAVPYVDLINYIAASDLEIMIFSRKSRNAVYSLPNKFFESIQAEVPMVTIDRTEMSELVNEYDIGYSIHQFSSKALSFCIKNIKRNPDEYNRKIENLRKAKKELCWETEKEILQQIIKEY